MNLLNEFVKAIWLMIPLYFAQTSPHFIRGKKPLDFGKNLPDGNRILGDGKTVEGTIFGGLIGGILGILFSFLEPILSPIILSEGELPHLSILISFLVAYGSLFGDLIGAFIKRRFGLKRGEKAPLLDQLDMVLGMLIFSYWFIEITTPMLIIMLVFVPLLHRLNCILGYKLGVKREPW